MNSFTVAWILFVSSFASLVSLGFGSKPWDVLLFAQQWPETVCEQQQQKGGSCNNYPKNTWTVHGIWPTQFGTTGPAFCDDRNRFNYNNVRSLQNDLTYYWPSIYGPHTKFWAHEWNKHGTCGTSVPQLSSQIKYFSQGLEWSKQYNMAKVLAAAGIVPGHEYTAQNIKVGIQQVIGKNPQILCENDKGQSTLTEIRICFSKSLELVDCDGTVVGRNTKGLLTNCRSRWVLYPQSK